MLLCRVAELDQILLTGCASGWVILKCLCPVGRGQKYFIPLSEQEVWSCFWTSQKEEPISTVFFTSLLVFQGDIVAIPWFSEVDCERNGSQMDVCPWLAWQWDFHYKDEALFLANSFVPGISTAMSLLHTSSLQAPALTLTLPGGKYGVLPTGVLLMSITCWLLLTMVVAVAWNLNVWTGQNHGLLHCFID